MSERDPWAPPDFSNLSSESAWTDSPTTPSNSQYQHHHKETVMPSNPSMPVHDPNTPINEISDHNDTPRQETDSEKIKRLEQEVRRSRELGPGKHDLDPYQIVVPGRITKNRFNSEIISFAINLALFKLIFVVNIPDEGSEAKVYCKFRLRSRLDDHGDGSGEQRTRNAYNRDRDRGRDNDSDSDMDDSAG